MSEPTELHIMRTELTRTPLGHVLEVTATRIVFEVDVDVARGFEAGDEVMLVKRLTAAECEPYREDQTNMLEVPPGWLTLRQYAERMGLTLRTVEGRARAGTIDASRMPSPSGKRLRWLVKDPA